MHRVGRGKGRVAPRVAKAFVALALAVAAAGVPLGAGAGASSTKLPPAPTPAPVAWQPCDGELAATGAECATLEVPLDYAHPKGETIQLALLRLAATDPARRIGSVLVNPGGPGASGLTFPLNLREQATRVGAPTDLFARFDVVGFDPRGVGQSAAVDCGDETTTYSNLDFTPDTKDEERALITATRTFARACQAGTGDLLRFIGTTNAARDMDQIRAALGEDTLTYLGFSYGTELGAVYADLFPKRVRAVVLDSAVDPKTYSRGVPSVLLQGASIDAAFQDFAADCAARPDCAFYSNGDPVAAFDALVASADAKPIPASDTPRVMTENQLVLTTAGVLSGLPETRGFLERALANARAGDASRLFDGYDAFLQPDTNFIEANLAIECLDARWPRGAAGVEALTTGVYRKFPRFGQSFQVGQIPCAYWPVRSDPPAVPTAKGAPTILVVGSTGDPLTALTEGQALAKQLDSAVFLTRDGPGHGAYLTNRCIDDAVNAFLIDLTVPAPNTRCAD